MITATETGRTLGRYELIRRIATGGMAEVFLARVVGIGRFEKLVVVKRMLPHLARDPQFVDMFLAEARIAARLDHPNIVRVEDIGEDTDNYFYAMEYVHGTDLLNLMKALSKQGRSVPIECAVTIGTSVCAALARAHDLVDADGRLLDLVHRDVSLPNILVSYEGAVKLADFGVARLADRDRTREGVVKGKLGYMSPEQCIGDLIDRRSDLFSLGIVLYEISTGERLFASGGDFSVMERIVKHQITPPMELVPGFPVELDAIIMTALQRDPGERYQSARDMQRDLEAFQRVSRMAGTATEIGALVSRTIPMGASRISEPMRQSDKLLSLRPDAGPPLAAADPSPPLAGESLRLVWRPTRRSLLAAAGAAFGLAIMLWAALTPSTAPETMKPAVPITDVTVAPLDPEPVSTTARHDAPATREPALRTPPRERRVTASPRPKPAPVTKPPSRKRDRVAVLAKPTTPSVAESPPPPEPSPQPDPPRIVASVAEDPPPAAPLPPPREVPPPVPPRPVAPAPVAPVAEGSLDATPSIATLDVRGPLPDSAVRQGVERILPSLRACYRTAARTRGATPDASIQLTFEIDETRTSRAVRARGGFGALAACSRAAAAHIRSRLAPDVGDARVEVTIEFKPV